MSDTLNIPTAPAPLALYVDATYASSMTVGPELAGKPMRVTVRTPVRATEAEAIADAAEFAKSHNMRVITCGMGPSAGNAKTYWVESHIGLLPNGNRGDKNEAGLKRYRAIRKLAARKDIPVRQSERPASTNSYGSVEEFDAAIAE